MELKPAYLWRDIPRPEEFGEFKRTTYSTWHCHFALRRCEAIKFNKKGEVKKWAYFVFYPNPITWLRRCDCCGKLGTPKHIRSRSFPAYKDEPYYSELCLPCRNKNYPLFKRRSECDKTKSIINKLNKEIKNARKNQNDRATQSISS